jgi:cilia- and flagella-associated protein 57
LENNQAFVLQLGNTEILKADEMNFEPLALPFHFQAITGMDVAVRKPLVVTCGLDKTVRVWNYHLRTLEVMKNFAEQPFCVSFHPSGLHVLVGFADALRLMNLLMDDLRPYKEYPVKACREAVFAHGGQYFAVADNTVIRIFQTYTTENIME